MGTRPGFRGASLVASGLAVVIVATAPLWAQSRKPSGKNDQSSGKADQSSAPSEEPTPSPKPGGLRMSRAVVCKSIDGYENYKPLPDAAQTSEEKLLIYYRPLRYRIDFVEGYYCAHLVQDNEIRKRGGKDIVRQKKKVVEYNPKSKVPLGPIYIRNTISLKELKPGDYDLTIILRDERDKGAQPTKQVVKFKITPPHDPRTKQPSQNAEDPPPEQ
jgi:hypothetical protein